MNFRSAPTLREGDKYDKRLKPGNAIRPLELEHAFALLLGHRNFAQYKLMMFLTGNADGFKLPTLTVCNRCGITEKNYRIARKELVERGWIEFEPTEEIYVNYTKIYDEYFSYLTQANGEKTGDSAVCNDLAKPET